MNKKPIKQVLLKKIQLFFSNDLLKSGGIYTVSSIIEKAIPFLLLPVLTRYLSAEDYGIVSMFSVLIGLTGPFTGLNAHSAILRNYFKEEINLPVYITNALMLSFASSIIIFGLFIVFSDFIAAYSGFPESWLLSVVLVSYAQFLVNVTLVVWQAQKKPFQYGAFKIFLSLLNMGLVVLFIVGLGYGWEGQVIGQVAAVVIFGIIGVLILWNKKLIKLKPVKEYINHALSYGVPLIPHVLSGFMITMIDRVFITNMVSISATGIYTVGYQIGMIIGVLAGSFNKAWTPWLFEKLNNGDKAIKKKIVRFTYGYFVAIIGLALGLSFIAPWFMKFLVGEAFFSATSYIFWVAIGYAFNGMYMMVTNYIFYEEKTHWLSWMTLMAAGVNIMLNYYLINIYGPIGAAVATTITYLFQFLATFYFGSKIYTMPWFERYT